MPYKMKLGNILDSTDDCIINSLGIHTDRYGRLCANIIKESGSTELKNYIDNLGKVNILDTFVTKGYNLKTKNIIHIVTPFKKYDNDCTKLVDAYRTLFNKAIEQGFKSISIAFIGTGANGYSDIEASNAISIAVDEIVEKEDENKELLTITLYVKPKTREEIFKEANLVYREIRVNEMPATNGAPFIDVKYTPYFDKDEFINIYHNKLITKTISTEDRIMLAQLTTCDGEEMVEVYNKYIKNNKPITYPYDFVVNYVNYQKDEWKEHKELKDTQRLIHAGIDKSRKYKLSIIQKIDSDELFAIAFVLGMNKAETLMFMQINGTTFNIYDMHSIAYMEYLNNMYDNINTFSDLDGTVWKLYKIYFGRYN